MLIATGVLIGIVLAVMTGVTVQNLQGLGWIPTTPIGIDLSLTWGRWLGLYANWEGSRRAARRAAGRLRLLRGRARRCSCGARRRAIRRVEAQEVAAEWPMTRQHG